MNFEKELEALTEKLQREAATDKIGKLLTGAAVIVRNRILIVCRSLNDEFLPGYYEIPGGGIDPRETILQGLERELFEETNLRIRTLEEYLGHFNAVSPSGQTVRQFNFLIEPTHDEVKLSGEHSHFDWWSLGEGKPCPMPMLDSIKDIIFRAMHSRKGSTHGE